VFERVLVANRGEIACRILRTLSAMGVSTVAVYSDADAGTAHVGLADRAVRLGPGPAERSYLDADAVLAAASDTGAEAIHPGYGFLSERADFAARVEAAGLTFIGPTPDQIRLFGAKHRARQMAAKADVPVLPGTELLDDLDETIEAAAAIGFPLMLKSTAGGGGIGMQACRNESELVAAFEQVRRVAETHFGSGRVYLERLLNRARHVEVQLFGDGEGRVVTLGERDCSLQRRHQKVLEETPAPGLSRCVRAELADAARRLGELVAYRSAGTVEFLLDVDTKEFWFLEVNTRLQVEHPVTEAVWGIDLVEWMVRLAGGEAVGWAAAARRPRGHAIEVRIYAEDPARGNRPNTGLVTEAVWPTGVRCDTWVETGTEVTSYYDPMLAKLIVHGRDRPDAVARLTSALAGTRLAGLETNLAQLRHLAVDPSFVAGAATLASLSSVAATAATVEVLKAGSLTTIQDFPGRLGLWHVGVPPSGPMDDLSFRLGNLAVGNQAGAPGLEMTAVGATVRFSVTAVVCLTGAPMAATVDGGPVAFWEPFTVPANGVLEIGAATTAGLRSYLLVRGGFDVPGYLGSGSTFTLGRFGGHSGRALRRGDVLHLRATDPGWPDWDDAPSSPVPLDDRPVLTNTWQVGVLEGPHGDAEFLTEEGLQSLLDAEWIVHFNSARTGVRLVGPRPLWAREDGGDAGLHPSNIHDTPYAVGAVDLTGDMPILLGPDGPSLGGFVCPVTVASKERWKMGQLRPGDRVRFLSKGTGDGGILGRQEGTDQRPAVTYRRSGDDYLLVEYGPMALDLDLRFRVHALGEWIASQHLEGVIDLTPGIRSLQLHLDPDRLNVERALGALRAAEEELPAIDDMEVSSRIVHLPLSWDDPATREAIARYMSTVRADAPWCPWNIEFIRRINGLESVDDVHRIVFAASYLVLGLGDVYLGAPVATPLDPRHRLVTTKYNPARTWTPENAVGIGGAYLCVYGMEGPGGYQFVGRTVPVWNRFRGTPPWLLRFFDQIHWYPVGSDELLDLRAGVSNGRVDVRVEPVTLRLADYHRFLEGHATTIAAFRERQQRAFLEERQAWAESGELARAEEPGEVAPPVVGSEPLGRRSLPAGAVIVESPLAAAVWQVEANQGDQVREGDRLLVLEAMKMETVVTAPTEGRIVKVLVSPGDLVQPGMPLVALR
jgi:urea carboxylase